MHWLAFLVSRCGKETVKHWDGSDEVEMLRVDAFIEDVVAVCRKHGMSISHEDGHGAFEIKDYDESCSDWLRCAHVRGVEANSILDRNDPCKKGKHETIRNL